MPHEMPHPNGADGRVAYAKALCSMGDIALNFYNRALVAEGYLQSALALDPHNALAKCLWAVCIWRSGGAMRQGDSVTMPGGAKWTRADFIDKTDELLLEAASLDPSHPTIVGHACAFLIEEREDYGTAQDYLHAALRLEPSDPDLYHAYALLQMKGGFEAAQALAQKEGSAAGHELLRSCQSEAVCLFPFLSVSFPFYLSLSHSISLAPFLSVSLSFCLGLCQTRSLPAVLFICFALRLSRCVATSLSWLCAILTLSLPRIAPFVFCFDLSFVFCLSRSLHACHTPTIRWYVRHGVLNPHGRAAPAHSFSSALIQR